MNAKLPMCSHQNFCIIFLRETFSILKHAAKVSFDTHPLALISSSIAVADVLIMTHNPHPSSSTHIDHTTPHIISRTCIITHRYGWNSIGVVVKPHEDSWPVVSARADTNTIVGPSAWEEEGEVRRRPCHRRGGWCCCRRGCCRRRGGRQYWWYSAAAASTSESVNQKYLRCRRHVSYLYYIYIHNISYLIYYVIITVIPTTTTRSVVLVFGPIPSPPRRTPRKFDAMSCDYHANYPSRYCWCSHDF